MLIPLQATMINKGNIIMNINNTDNNNLNECSAEPKFNVGDVVWTPAAGRDRKGNRIYIQTKVLALVFARGQGESYLFGYKLLDNEDNDVRKSEYLFATKEECEAHIDERDEK